jgi:hypothetical protein
VSDIPNPIGWRDVAREPAFYGIPINVLLAVLLRDNAWAALGFASSAVALLSAGLQGLASRGWRALYEWRSSDD